MFFIHLFWDVANFELLIFLLLLRSLVFSFSLTFDATVNRRYHHGGHMETSFQTIKCCSMTIICTNKRNWLLELHAKHTCIHLELHLLYTLSLFLKLPLANPFLSLKEPIHTQIHTDFITFLPSISLIVFHSLFLTFAVVVVVVVFVFWFAFEHARLYIPIAYHHREFFFCHAFNMSLVFIFIQKPNNVHTTKLNQTEPEKNIQFFPLFLYTFNKFDLFSIVGMILECVSALFSMRFSALSFQFLHYSTTNVQLWCPILHLQNNYMSENHDTKKGETKKIIFRSTWTRTARIRVHLWSFAHNFW